MGNPTMKPEPVRLSVLTLKVRPAAAGRLADRIRRAWGLEPVELTRPGEPAAWIEVYFENDVEALLAAKVLRSNPAVLASSIRPQDERDWMKYWKRHFHSRDVGRRLRICPVWDKAGRKRPGRRTVVIQPGMSFGTGEHFTTRFCLEMVDQWCGKPGPRSFLDVGTGSGILAIAAARLGVARVVGVDNDPQALGQARENAALNRLSKRIQFEPLDITASAPRGRYDVVCANLFAPMLIQSAPALAGAARRVLIVSGIREFEADGVADAFAAHRGREVVRDGDGEWCGLVFRFGG